MFESLPRGHFGAITADPPWHYRTRSPKLTNPESSRHADRHYATMSIEAIAAMPVRDLAARDCHLFLWTTGPHLRLAFDVMEAWGFRFSTLAFTWAKLKKHTSAAQVSMLRTIPEDFHVGLGLTTRKNCEFVLLGRRGSPKRIARNVRELIVAPRREHSRKPDEFYRRVEAYCAGPYLELFARERRPLWTTWGNEADKFSDLPTQIAAE